jgi:hypothetical protein
MLFMLQSGIAASQRSIPVDQRAAQYPEARSSAGQWYDPNTGPAFRIIGLAVVTIALIVEVLLTLRRPRSLCSRLMPGLTDERRSSAEHLPDMKEFDTYEAQRLVFGDDYTSATGMTYTLRSLVEHVTRIDEAMTSRLDLTQRESERTWAADAARRRANIEVTGPYRYDGSLSFYGGCNMQQWKIINRGPALATQVRL